MLRDVPPLHWLRYAGLRSSGTGSLLATATWHAPAILALRIFCRDVNSDESILTSSFPSSRRLCNKRQQGPKQRRSRHRWICRVPSVAGGSSGRSGRSGRSSSSGSRASIACSGSAFLSFQARALIPQAIATRLVGFGSDFRAGPNVLDPPAFAPERQSPSYPLLSAYRSSIADCGLRIAHVVFRRSHLQESRVYSLPTLIARRVLAILMLGFLLDSATWPSCFLHVLWMRKPRCMPTALSLRRRMQRR
jgi:hypothetical protein